MVMAVLPDTEATLKVTVTALVFKVEEFPHVYVMEYCHRRRQERVFRVDRMAFVEYQ